MKPSQQLSKLQEKIKSQSQAEYQKRIEEIEKKLKEKIKK